MHSPARAGFAGICAPCVARDAHLPNDSADAAPWRCKILISIAPSFVIISVPQPSEGTKVSEGWVIFALPIAAKGFLERLRREHKVIIDGDCLSTTRLSQGQRKRLALLAAHVEQRPILLLDEWAADQDPAFRSFFYFELLPELKRCGKTIIAISHDDRYFGIADRVLKCESGVLQEYKPSGSTQEVGVVLEAAAGRREPVLQ